MQISLICLSLLSFGTLWTMLAACSPLIRAWTVNHHQQQRFNNELDDDFGRRWGEVWMTLMMMMMLTMKMTMMMTRIRNSVLVRVGGPWWKLSGKVGGVTKVWFTLYSVAGSSTLSGVVCHNGPHSDTVPVLLSDTGYTHSVKTQGWSITIFSCKVDATFFFWCKSQPK